MPSTFTLHSRSGAIPGTPMPGSRVADSVI